MVGILITALVGLSLFILGLFIKRGKGLMLIAGYNTMPKHERDKVDKDELAKKTGNLLFRMALAFVLMGVTAFFKLTWAYSVFILTIIADAIITAIRLTRRNSKAKTAKIGTIAAIVMGAIVFIAVGLMVYDGEKDPVIHIADSRVHIEAVYGLDISGSDVKDILLIDKSMDDIEPDMHRDNGYGGFGSTLKGHFSSEKIGNFMLFVKSDVSPTIRIERHGADDIYLGFSDGEKTRMIYRELKAAIQPQKNK